MERGKRAKMNPVDDWIGVGYSLEEAEILAKLSEVEEQQIVTYEELKTTMDKVEQSKQI